MKLYKFCKSFVSISSSKKAKLFLETDWKIDLVSRKASQRYLSAVVSFLSFRTIWLVECCRWNYLSQWKCPIYLWESKWIESLFDTVLFISWHKTCPIWLGQIPISCLHKDCHVCSNASWIYLVRQTEIRAGRSSLSEISRGNFVCLAVTWVASKGTWYQNLHVFHSQSLLYLDYFLTCTVYGFWNRIALLTFVTCVKKLILHHEKSPFLHSLFFFLFIAQGNHNEQNEFSYLADFLFCMRRLVSSLKWTFEMLLLSLQYSSLLFDVGFLNPTPQPPSPPPCHFYVYSPK